MCFVCLNGVSMNSSFTLASSYRSRHFFRRSSGVVNITHGMVVVSMEHPPSLHFVIQIILYSMDAIFSFVD